jgi:hypothetical protein
MTKRFQLEKKIMSCWNVVEDIKTLNEQINDGEPLTVDGMSNYLLGLETVYQVKFEQLFALFEKMIKEGDIK